MADIVLSDHEPIAGQVLVEADGIDLATFVHNRQPIRP
jgi:hypothetical protein